jgi:L-alanine-DL-glutamate epimerase-like enolase superfamily enzyme
LHSILIAPHGTGNGLIGLAALAQVCAALPENFIAFEHPIGLTDWWPPIIRGLPDPIVVDSHITVWDRPGLGVNLIPEAAQRGLSEEDAEFFAHG